MEARALVLVMVMCLCGPWAMARADAQVTPKDRANAALQTLWNHYWSPSNNYLLDYWPGDNNQVTAYWTYAQGWMALTQGLQLFANQGDYEAHLIDLYRGQARKGWHSDYYDDETWMTMTLTLAYQLTHNSTYLSTATNLFKDVMNAWDTTCCGDIKGGVWWDIKHTQKATASNAGPAAAALELYRITNDGVYLAWAQQVYNFWWNRMVNQQTGQICDNFDSAGQQRWWAFTYNQGMMIVAATRMYQATRNSMYLSQASLFFNFTVAKLSVSSSSGPVMFDGSGCSGDCDEFKGITFRFMVELHHALREYLNNHTPTSDALYYSTLAAVAPSLDQYLHNNADAIWNLARNAQENAFGVNWAGPAPPNGQRCTQSQQNSAAQALASYALM